MSSKGFPELLVKTFNETYPVGTEVQYWRGFKNGMPSGVGKTRSEAWVLCGSPVVLIEGTSGGIALTHVEVIQPAQTTEVSA